jgi:hypothetical protein
MLPDLSPRSHAAYLLEKEDHLLSWQVDLEATEAELKCQRQDVEQQRAAHPLDNNDTRTGALSGLCFPRMAYNMVAATCRLEGISDTPIRSIISGG